MNFVALQTRCQLVLFFEKMWYTFYIEIFSEFDWYKKLLAKNKVRMNFNKNKITLQGKKWKALLFAGSFVLSFGLFNNVAHAADTVSYCYCKDVGTANVPVAHPNTDTTKGDKECNVTCRDLKPALANPYYFFWAHSEILPLTANAAYTKCVDDKTWAENEKNGNNSIRRQEAVAAQESIDTLNTCGTDMGCHINFLLFSILRFFGWILTGAATLFEWIVKPENISGPTGLLNNGAVKDVWIMVRDTLNMTFILVLLFSAFCTVFQVEKWNLKKVWLSILINALLVNFSYPIARFFIDVSNVAMYYFLNNMFSGTGQGSGSSIMASFGQVSQLSEILVPDGYAKAETSYIIAAIVFTFIFGVTLYVLAALFVIRLVALVMVVMFSPIGFVANIFPEMSKFASDWWSNLFKYSFFGPIMVFMMMVSLKIMASIPSNFNLAAQKNAPADMSEWIAHTAFFMIPIFILWMSMGIAQKMGIEGADKVVGSGQKFAKWAGSMVTTKPAGFAWSGIKKGAKAGAVGAAKKFERDVLGEKLSPRAWMEAWKERGEEADKRFMGKATGGARDSLNMMLEGAKTNYRQIAIDKGILERRKEMKDSSEHTSYWLNNLKGLVGQNSERARKDIKSFAGIAYGNRDQDEIMKFVKDNFDEKILAGGKSFRDIGIKEDELGVSAWNVNQAVMRMLEASGEKKDQIDKTILDLGEIAAGNESVGYGGADYNEKGQLVSAENKEEQAKAVVGKFATVGEVQKLAQMLHRNNIVDEREEDVVDKDGKTVKVMGINTEFDEMVRQGMLTPMKDHVNRHNGSFYSMVGKESALLGMRMRLEKLRNEGVSEEQIKGASEWIDALESYKKHGAKGKENDKSKNQQDSKVVLVDSKGRPMSS